MGNNRISFIENSRDNQELIKSKDSCDKYDYLIAVACGVVGGMVDIFFVGSPQDSKLGKWTDKQVDNVVKNFAKLYGWKPGEGKEDSIASAIGFLERNFKVNYDHRHSGDVGNLFNMSAKNHHMMSLAHSPDIIGLFFSILNQFTSTATFLADGKLITVDTENFELKGSNFISKIFCGIVNWIGHLMSDMAGSSGSRGGSGRGSGIVMPFYELFGFCKFGNFSVGKDKQDLATIATRAFQEGYDFRFGLATAIPVVITELLTRVIWSFREYFQYKKPLKECIPTTSKSRLRVMLIVGNGVLCLMDAIDAGVRSGGNYLKFFMRINLIAWFRFTMLVLKEVYIRVGIFSLQSSIDSYKRINGGLLQYIKELEKIDIDQFKKETESYNELIDLFDDSKNYKEVNLMLLNIFDKMGYNKPWQGDFDDHMSNKNATLIFD